MALVLNEKYSEFQNFDFLKNRLLRILPSFWIAGTLGLIIFWDQLVSTFNSLTTSGKMFMVFENILLFGQDISHVICLPLQSGGCAEPVTVSTNGPAWSLAVELLFYLFAPLILRSLWRTLAFLALGLVYQLGLLFVEFPTILGVLLKSNESVVFNYNLYPASFTYFALGALAYRLWTKPQPYLYGVIVASVIPISLFDFYLPWWQLLIFVAAVPALFSLTKDNRLDKLLGELSFPIYIFHWPILFLLVRWHNPNEAGILSLGTWVTLVSTAVALLVYNFVEKPITKNYRNLNAKSVKKSANSNRRREPNVVIWKVGLLMYLLSPIIILLVLLYSNTP
jgi:peptidoglycan/LPS O-acetylase OafA/YrhL